MAWSLLWPLLVCIFLPLLCLHVLTKFGIGKKVPSNLIRHSSRATVFQCSRHIAQGMPKSFLFDFNSKQNFRFHYKQYLAICAAIGFEPKAPVPKNWKPKEKWANLKNVSLLFINYILDLNNLLIPSPLSSKTSTSHKGWSEGVLAWSYCWCWLGRLYFSVQYVGLRLTNFVIQAFCFIEWAPIQHLICYLCPKLKDNDIPKHFSIVTAVTTKVIKLDEIDKKLVSVSL